MGDLLRMGLPPNLRNEKGDSLLMLASYHGHADAVRVLMEHGADPELANDRGQTPLAGAAFKGDMATIQCLFWTEARMPNGRSEGGKTPLMIAAMFNRTEIVEVLLARGADPQARDACGLTAEALPAPWALQTPPRNLSQVVPKSCRRIRTSPACAR